MVLLLLVRLDRPVHQLHCRLIPQINCAGFWQYGHMRWGQLRRYLATIIDAPAVWSIFERELNNPQQRGALCPQGAEIVQIREEGYVLLSISESLIVCCQATYLLLITGLRSRCTSCCELKSYPLT
jgi:hypothetical protein